MTGFSLTGGLIGFAAGEAVLSRWEGIWHETLVMGVYFGLFALIVGLCCLLAEIIAPELNGRNWRLRYAADGWKWLLPSTLLLLFACGALFQWIYGLQFSHRTALPQDYVLVMDTSESMKETDPDEQSLEAAKSLIGRMDKNMRAGILTFNENVAWVQKLTELKNNAAKSEVMAQLDAVASPIGGTDIGLALTEAIGHMTEEKLPGRKGAVILISDGYSEMDFDNVTAPYKQEGIIIHTIGIGQPNEQGSRLLARIAEATGGTYQDVKQAELISDAFQNIDVSGHRYHLMGERTGPAAASGYYAVLRVVMIMLIGALLGLSLGIIFDNRYLARSFALGGAVAGVLAGLILEFGLSSNHPVFVRGVADLLLAVVLSLSTFLFAVREGNTVTVMRRKSAREYYGRPEGERNRFGDNSKAGRRFR
ncbi:hypothetical protein J2TS4_12180 [Paenibacillus sp. J2TS4]|nr:hypothetical protein J2TS4_12180 [Paenibacillus sp. J2TS4]